MKLLYVNVFFFLLIPTLFLIYLIATNRQGIEKVLPSFTLGKLSIGNSGLSTNARNVLLFSALILMIIALSRPVLDNINQEVRNEKVPLVLALDISKSMNARDIFPSRFELAKKKAVDLLQKSHNTSAALIMFARSSFIVSPLSTDFDSLVFLLKNFEQNDKFSKGSNIFNLLVNADSLLKANRTKNLVILTDGGNKKEYTKELEFVKKNKLKVYVIALASKKPTPIPIDPDLDEFITDENRNIVTLSLNESIKELAVNSGGGYIEYSLSDDDVQAVLTDIYTKSSKEFFENKKLKVYTELFYYPLGLGIFFLFLAFFSFPRRSGKVQAQAASVQSVQSKPSHALMIVLSTFFLFTSKADAYLFDFIHIRDAQKSYANQDYKSSTFYYQKVDRGSDELYYNRANAYYKQKDYKEAVMYYHKISGLNRELKLKKYHNLGNAYAYMHQFDKAVDAYKEALKIKKDKQTLHNLNEILKFNNADQNQKNNSPQNKQQKKNKNDQANNKDSQHNNNKNKKDQDDISNREEEKWLGQLTSDKTKIPVLMYEMEGNAKSRHDDKSYDKPW
jgi:Ca-activated chloride channel family protein